MTGEAAPHMAHLQPNGSEWPVPPVDGYTVDDLYRLDLPPHTELMDGSLVFVSPQRKFHSLAMYLLEQCLRSTVPETLRVRREMAVVISKRNVPEPDLVVVQAAADADQRQTRYEVKDVVLAVEVVSPDSEDRDRDTKPHKYAAAGIAHFWRVEMAGEDDRPVVYVYELDPVTKAYALTGIHRDQLKVAQPYPIAVDLTAIDHL
ncbi:Endonuclease, Uma2 family (restriction endonuclease fold) [Actinacidiphila rubida]|uniref:Endonuclease, Uma2 family (Restriction endonuclease fold) n=2 Tax=Actinacidiphila rubida TaxID=310780 RepID=A0A1H8SG23_9ACTN|nr:Endonuclease, Uma2 family (restriction endonuclease fold) [Actinacidiphila rubida]